MGKRTFRELKADANGKIEPTGTGEDKPKNARTVSRLTKRHGMTVKRREDPMRKIVGPLSPCGRAR